MDYSAKKQLGKIIQEFKPDIIHSHTFKAGLITRASRHGVPVVHTYHGHLFDDPEFSGFKSFVICILERKLAKNTTKIITVGQRVAENLISKRIGIQSQYINIPPGVEELNIPPRKEALRNLGISEDARPIIGWIARMTGVKNPMRLLEVASEIPTAHFLMAGGGDLLKKVTASAPSNVTVLGWAAAEDLFGASDIIVSTSENEGMPVALIEAQLAGKPVVATDVGGVSEIIANHETGVITDKNSGSIAAEINILILETQKRNQMSSLAISRAQSRFSVDGMIQAHVHLYKSIVH